MIEALGFEPVWEGGGMGNTGAKRATNRVAGGLARRCDRHLTHDCHDRVGYVCFSITGLLCHAEA